MFLKRSCPAVSLYVRKLAEKLYQTCSLHTLSSTTTRLYLKSTPIVVIKTECEQSLEKQTITKAAICKPKKKA